MWRLICKHCSTISQAIFNDRDYKLACGTNTDYVTTGNYAWVDWRFTTAPGVPILRTAVVNYSKTKFPRDGDLEGIEVTIGMDSKDHSPSTMKGSLKAMTPQEDIIAAYWALGDQMQSGHLTADDVARWTKLFRTAVFTFKVLPTNEDK